MADSYQVTSQTQGIGLTPDGRTETVMEIAFTVQPAGVSSTVQVPMSDYTVDKVAALLQERADVINGVHQL